MSQTRSHQIPPEDLRRLAITDELTGLYNRRYLKIRLSEELERAWRSKRSLSVLLLDLDGLKSVNDMYGHLRGDQLLLSFARLLQKQVRSIDLVARFAGDEFVVLLPESEFAEAQMIAERIRSAVAEGSFEGDPPLKVTTSIGLALYPDSGETIEALLEAADRGLYKAKRLGRNRVVKINSLNTDSPPVETPVESRLMMRDEELYLMGKSLHEAIDGNSGGILITGEMGVGCSRLLSEFHTIANQAGARTLFESCFEQGQYIPYQPIRDLLRHYIRNNNQNAYSLLLQMSSIQRMEMMRLLPDLDYSRLDLDHAPIKTPIDEEFQLYDAVSWYLKRLSHQDPVVIILDDIHWLDEASTRLLLYLLRDARDSRLLFVASYRSSDPGDTQVGKLDFGKWLRSVKTITKITHIELNRFNVFGTKELVNASLSQVMPDRFIQRIHQESEGNPFFIQELIKALIESKVLFRAENSWQVREVDHISAPSSIRDMISSRLAMLDEEDRQILTQGAVIGRIFEFDVIYKVSQKNEGHLMDVLERLEKLGLISQKPSWEGEKFQFTHKKVWEFIVEQIEPRRKKKMHQQVALALETLYKGNIDLIAGELAFHYTEGKLIDRAIQLYRRSGDKANMLHAQNSALRYYSQAIKLIRKKPEKFSEELSVLHQKIALILKDQGRNMQAINEFHRAFAMGGDLMMPLRRAQIFCWIAEIHLENGRFEAAANEIMKAEQLIDPKHNKAEILRLDICKAISLAKRGEYEACLELTGRHLNSADETNFPAEISDLLDLNAASEYAIGNRDKAVRLYARSLEIRRKVKDLSRISKSYKNLAGIFMEASRWDDALFWYNKCIKIEEILGHLTALTQPLMNIARIQGWRGNLEEAKVPWERANKILEMANDMPGLTSCYCLQMELFMRSGNLESAEKSLELAEKLHTEYDIGVAGQRVMFCKAKLALHQKKYKKALILAKDISRIKELFCDPFGEAEIKLLLGEIYSRMTQYETASAYLEKSEKLYRRLGDRFKLGLCLMEQGKIAGHLENAAQSCQMLSAAKDIFFEIGSMQELETVRKLLDKLEG